MNPSPFPVRSSAYTHARPRFIYMYVYTYIHTHHYMCIYIHTPCKRERKLEDCLPTLTQGLMHVEALRLSAHVLLLPMSKSSKLVLTQASSNFWVSAVVLGSQLQKLRVLYAFRCEIIGSVQNSPAFRCEVQAPSEIHLEVYVWAFRSFNSQPIRSKFQSRATPFGSVCF